MCSSKFKTKKTYGGWLKYVIFNVLLFGVFFALQMNGGNKALAVESFSYEIHQSNHKGDKNSNEAVERTSDAYTWYVQGTGVTKKDVVSMTLKIPYMEINGVVAFESNYTGAAGSAKDYDSYKKSTEGVWSALSGTGLSTGTVLASANEMCVSTFASSAANSTTLNANNGSSTVYSLMCIDEDDVAGYITIQYAYTIRNAGYGVKNIKFAVYNDSAYLYDPSGDTLNNPILAEEYDVFFVVAKPANEFTTSGFTWLDEAADTCGTNSSGTGRPTTDNICVKYINGTLSTEAKTLELFLPKELAYTHDVSTETDPNKDNQIIINSIKDNTIYAINSFLNVGTTTNNSVRYYYYDFVLDAYDDADNAKDIAKNETIDPYGKYYITISIDASGNYVFYIKDIFGNSFTSGQVDVDDVSKTNIIVDYTNAVELNIMESTGNYNDSDWRQDWEFAITSPNKVNFDKMVADEITVTVYVFQRIVIANGVYGGNGTAGAEMSEIEDIAKQPLGYKDGNAGVNPNQYTDTGVVIWRVANISGDDSTNTTAGMVVSCGTDADLLCSASNITFSSGEFSGGTTTTRNNKITFKVKSNGRYRIMITDNYGNTTNTLTGDEKNPKVEVSVIDRTNPVITSDLADTTNSIESFPYVIGGGEKTAIVPNVDTILSDANTGNDEYWKDTTNYTSIYYNSKGTKIFNYQDALEIAKIKVVDNVNYYNSGNISTIYSGYVVNFGYNANQCFDVSTGSETKTATSAGVYCDPTYNTASDRKTDGTAYNLHNYIINNNFSSFTGGLVKLVGYTDYDSNTAGSYSTIDTAYSTQAATNATVEFVNAKSATTFLGYLKIAFKNSADATICELKIDLTKDNGGTSDTDNKACFELMNQYIDDVENFKMVFTAEDFLGHGSNAFTVSVSVIDTTNPGIDMSGADADNSIEYSNENTDCRLEIDNYIQTKTQLLTCYKLGENLGTGSATYNFKDNNINHADSTVTLTAGKQYYLADGNTASDAYYHNKITLSIKEEATWTEISGDNGSSYTGRPHLYKSGYHQFKLEINDHWNPNDNGGAGTASDNNVLTIYLTYYVNPRTLLIEPLANEKMYGEEEPTFDYCVYVNKTTDTFYLEDKFFEVDFINEYFTYIYCTRDVYAQIENSKRYTRNTGTSSKGYAYHTYTQSNSGEYLLVNNTYVKIVEASDATGNVYKMEYTPKDDGDFFLDDGTYYPIKSGYLYDSDACLNAATSSTAANSVYIKLSNNNCKQLTSAKRYTEKYTKVASISAGGTYLKYNLNTVSSAGYDNISDFADTNTTTNANTALVNNNVFAGKLARVESRCYNTFADNYYNDGSNLFANYLSCNENATASAVIRNDNVGQYHMVLGTLSIKEGTGTSYNEDYVIKINTNYVANKFSVTNADQTIRIRKDGTTGVLVDDGLKTESSINFTIRQAVLTIRANGSTKRFGEQDPYSNNWNDVKTPTNIVSSGYLGGYSVTGWRYNGNFEDSTLTNNATNYIIAGTLRREVGEEVGIYDICNISGNPADINSVNCLAGVINPLNYDTTNPYYFYAYGNYATNGTTSVAALTIRTNLDIYGNAAGRTLNTDTRNYAISFIKADFKIESTNLVIQPAINQGKEYATTEYNDPLWEMVVYGETIKNVSGTWTSNIVKASDAANFSGYTATIAVEANEANPGFGESPYNAESEVYYARRKFAPSSIVYEYFVNDFNVSSATKYAKDGNYYYQSTTAGTDGNLYVYAYGQYYALASTSATSVDITVTGRLVNETYTLFDDTFELERTAGKNVSWYDFTNLKNYKEVEGVKRYTIKKVANSNQECIIGEDSVVTGTGSGTVDCRNYNVIYRENAPVAQNASGQDVSDSAVTDKTIVKYVTTEGSSPLYRPDGINACNSGYYSASCGTSSTTIQFEIFKREIILEFIDDNYTFIYGNRYDYYDGGDFGGSGNSYQYNTNTDGIFNIKDGTGLAGSRVGSSEGDIFLCYSDLGDYLVDCTNNNDYGVTAGDTWTSIGLKFYLHNTISNNSNYYDSTNANHKAVPAGTYYVYAAIAQLTGTDATTKNSTINQNYKFTYRGGTLTIKPKVTNVQLTGYTMEYGESKYDSYGLGSNYSDYTSYKLAECMNDASYLVTDSTKDTLITDCSSATTNVVGNTYGFVVEGLDKNDTIAGNFNGRPARTAKNASNVGAFDDVGYYKINVGTITSIKDTSVSFKQCATNLSGGIIDSTKTDCIFAGEEDHDTGNGANAINYDITYSLNNNEGAHLFIVPANLDITVYPNQTKMYGCAYSQYITDATAYYTYTYDGGYSACDTTDEWAVDLAYKYKVEGDKDVKKEHAGITYYDVTTDVDGARTFASASGSMTYTKPVLTDDRLYRVLHNADASVDDYAAMKNLYANYQGQAVDVYTISLGKLNVVQNSNAAMCDAYNNPVLEGGSPCRNYNINYYGNSSVAVDNTHEYKNEKEINLSDLTLYVLNYQEDTSGNYVLIDGKYVNLKDVDRFSDAGGTSASTTGDYALISKYVKAYGTDSIQKYKKLAAYEKSTTCGSDCYVYLVDDNHVLSAGTYDGYVALSSLSSLRYNDAKGTTQQASGDYLKIVVDGTTKYVKVDSLTKFKKNTAEYAEDSSGQYVFINDEYVQLSSLQRYSYDDTTELYTISTTGEYVQVYEVVKISNLARYKLLTTEAGMYTQAESGASTDDNLFVFVNGSFVSYNSLIVSNGQTAVTVNTANTNGAGGAVVGTSGTVATDIKFTIVARIVYVHPEYNVKPYGDSDPVEYITCDEIKSAYDLTNFDGRSGYYCGTDTSNNASNNATKIDLGVTMYYAVQNSLAKAPWTAWTDYTSSNVQTRKTYNDIQYDVLTGKVSRKIDPTRQNNDDTTDKAGKYTFDFVNVTTNDYLNGNNYMIQYVTKYDMKNTYVRTGESTFKTVYELLLNATDSACAYGDAHCIATSDGPRKVVNNKYELNVSSGYVVNSGGTATSLSLIQKYYGPTPTTDKTINYWYQGFYRIDSSGERVGELAKWWANRAEAEFDEDYDTFKYNEGNYANKNADGTSAGGFFTSVAREVYFEIIKRTIYLYAVDVEKTYGDADKYSDFLVAICPNDLGYVKTVDGNGDVVIRCKSESASYGYGLSPEDYSSFINNPTDTDETKHTMNQWQIKNAGVSSNSDYIFKGLSDMGTNKFSFGIYFRRDPGENAGSYTVTACATQSTTEDCMYEVPSTNPDYEINHLGDNYNIVEIPGVMTIKTREINITPDSDQGFQYGNYTDNGSMPNITFTEARNDVAGENGLVYGSGTYLFDGTTQVAKITKSKNASDKYTSLYEFKIGTVDYIIDGRNVIEKDSNTIVAKIAISTTNNENTKTVKIGATTYTIIQKARCLVNISGIYTVCISDAQNESLANSLGENYYEYGVTYNVDLTTTKVFDGSKTTVSGGVPDYSTSAAGWTVVSNNNRTYYSYNVYADDYSNPAKEFTRTEATVSSGVVTERDDRNALDLKCGSTSGLRYSRDVCDYKIVSGELSVDDTLIAKETIVYIYVTKGRRYNLDGTYTQADDGAYVKYGEGLYAEYNAAQMYSRVCTTNASGVYTCEYKIETGENAKNNYLRVVINPTGGTATTWNYKVKSINETVDFSITPAGLNVTPVEKQYKIYGEADIEIKFTVETTYTVTRTHYQTFANSNIIEICNASTCYSGTNLDAYRYASIGADSASSTGIYILLTKGWTVKLNSYAYDEENTTDKGNNLDYGVNRSKYKYDPNTTPTITQVASGLKHYDKYTTYNSEITTNRILIGNLYVENNDQTVGEKNIVISGMKVGVNNLASQNSNKVNYSLTFTSKLFVIVPRPVNVEIENITKTYGQATDVESCDNGYMTECIVGDGILITDTGSDAVLDPDEDYNGSKLINNFNVIQKDLAAALGATAGTGGIVKVTLNTANVTGIEVVYMKNSTDYTLMNMPIVTSVAYDAASTSPYKNFVTVDAGHYYTATLDASSKGQQERKNDTLNIQVQRDSLNIARNLAACLVSTDADGCEDVGEYYLSFTTRSATGVEKEETVENAYYSKYWGYNKNYYVVVYNNFENSGWSTAETTDQGYKSITANENIYYTNIHNATTREYTGLTYTADSTPGAVATLKIRKRSIEIVAETISDYTYIQNDSGTHLRTGTAGSYKYYKITDNNRYTIVDSKYVQKATGEYLCTYATNNTSTNCHEILAANRFNLKSNTVGEKYSIEQNMDVPELLGPDNNKGTHHTTYEAITWYDHPLQVRTGDTLYGEVAYCYNAFNLDAVLGLDGLRDDACPAGKTLYYYNVDSNANGIKDINEVGQTNFFNTSVNGYYIITREKDKLYIRNGESITTGAYEANNYTTTFVNGILQIDIDETAPIINIETDFIIKEANSGVMSKQAFTGTQDVLGFLNNLTTNGCASLTATRTADGATTVASTCDTGTTFVFENDSLNSTQETDAYKYVDTLLEWFGLTSFDPSIMRANAAVGKRYDARWYIAIQSDFNQKKVGDYSLFIYAQDNAGNISLASMVTLRIVDTTAPIVGDLNLYSAKVACKANSDCTKEENWVVAEDIYLPISTLTAENLGYISTADKSKKYLFTGKSVSGGVVTYNYSENNYFGTYYKISANTDARAVKHESWTNSSAGIYMTVTGGDDNSLTYLNTAIYDKYNISGTTITSSASGTHLLLGSFVKVDNLTKYRAVALTGPTDNKYNEVTTGGTKTVYIPDKTGTIVRYKGYYYDLSTGNYIGTTPSDDYGLNLYKRVVDGGTGVVTYTKVMPANITDGSTYVIRDGDMYEIPATKYSSSGAHASDGTYVNIEQWNHYYSRDGGTTWAKYDRDTASGYLALGQDGQRLIMIKAIDNGYTYGETGVNKEHVLDAYCKTFGDKTCELWQSVVTGTVTIKDVSNNNIDYKEYIGSKVWKYNVSEWDSYTEGTTTVNKDRKYAYLDTIIPDASLSDQFLEIYEYGCADIGKCSTNHSELFGKAIDGYLFKLDNLVKYDSNGNVQENGAYVRVNNELILIETSRRFNLSGTTLTPAIDGEYIYLGNTDSVISVDPINGKIAALSGSTVANLTGEIKAFDKMANATVTMSIGKPTNVSVETAATLQSNTKYIESGLGMGANQFDGIGNSELEFGVTFGALNAIEAEKIAFKYTHIFIYAFIHGGEGDVINHQFYDARGYYKFSLTYDASTSKYKVLRCFNSTSVIGDGAWCDSPTAIGSFANMKEAVDALLSVYETTSVSNTNNKFNFNGNEITFTLDYRVYDIAGNASMYERKGVIFTSFTRTIAGSNGGAAAAALAVEIPQNANVASALSNFQIVTTTGKALRAEERVLQTVYYNGALVSSRSAYDLSTLSELDTTVPGEYKIVYTVERKDGAQYVQGNSVELLVTIKPNVAIVKGSGLELAPIVVATSAIIGVGLIVLFIEFKKKKKTNNV